MSKFDNTRSALVEYDLAKPVIEAMFESVDCDADAHAWEAAEKAALDKVRVAFYEDTKSINSLHNCMLVGEEFMRKCTTLKEADQ